MTRAAVGQAVLMREILPGIYDWTTFHAPIRANVNSHYVAPAGLLIDPKVPEDGIDTLAARGRPEQIALTSGLHHRDAQRIAEHFRIPIVTSREGAERLGDRLEVQSCNDGDEIAPGVRAIRVDILCPDEYALHIAHGEGALAIADGITHYGGALGFFADDLLGDDPDEVKEGLKHRFGALLQRDFDALLFAHGDPIPNRGKAKLRDFVTSPVGHEDFGQAL